MENNCTFQNIPHFLPVFSCWNWTIVMANTHFSLLPAPSLACRWGNEFTNINLSAKIIYVQIYLYLGNVSTDDLWQTDLVDDDVFAQAEVSPWQSARLYLLYLDVVLECGLTPVDFLRALHKKIIDSDQSDICVTWIVTKWRLCDMYSDKSDLITLPGSRKTDLDCGQ